MKTLGLSFQTLSVAFSLVLPAVSLAAGGRPPVHLKARQTKASSQKPVQKPAQKTAQAPTKKPVPKPTQKPVQKPAERVREENPAQTQVSDARPQVDRGWLPEYEEHIRDTVTEFPALLNLEPSRMKSFCPGWADMNRNERIEFYVDLLYAITGPESSFNRLSSTPEPMGRDRVTGRTVRSEGLLQLSYQDPMNYRGRDGRAYDYCPFDYDQDRALYERELRTGVKQKGRSTLNAYNNLQCGLFIFNLLVDRLYPSQDFRPALGKYWAVMRPDRTGYTRVRKALVAKQPSCNL